MAEEAKINVNLHMVDASDPRLEGLVNLLGMVGKTMGHDMESCPDCQERIKLVRESRVRKERIDALNAEIKEYLQQEFHSRTEVLQLVQSRLGLELDQANVLLKLERSEGEDKEAAQTERLITLIHAMSSLTAVLIEGFGDVPQGWPDLLANAAYDYLITADQFANADE